MAESSRNARLEADLRRQAKTYGRLTPEEEGALLASRDGDAFETLVKHNLDLVADQAESHAGRGLGFADLYQEGNVGLVDAIGAYDGKGAFRDFASLHIGLQMDSLIQTEAVARREAAADVEDARLPDTGSRSPCGAAGRPGLRPGVGRSAWAGTPSPSPARGGQPRRRLARSTLTPAPSPLSPTTTPATSPASISSMTTPTTPSADPRRPLPAAPAPISSRVE